MKTIQLKAVSLIVALGAVLSTPAFAGHTATEPQPFEHDLVKQTLLVPEPLESDPVATALAQVLEKGEVFVTTAYAAVSAFSKFVAPLASVSNDSFIMKALRMAALAGLLVFRNQIESSPAAATLLKVIVAAKLLNGVSTLQ